nr:histidine kinase-like ATPase, ATP-binding domain-containing protein [Tanacetum cinerariifolium]
MNYCFGRLAFEENKVVVVRQVLLAWEHAIKRVGYDNEGMCFVDDHDNKMKIKVKLSKIELKLDRVYNLRLDPTKKSSLVLIACCIQHPVCRKTIFRIRKFKCLIQICYDRNILAMKVYPCASDCCNKWKVWGDSGCQIMCVKCRMFLSYYRAIGKR